MVPKLNPLTTFYQAALDARMVVVVRRPMTSVYFVDAWAKYQHEAVQVEAVEAMLAGEMVAMEVVH